MKDNGRNIVIYLSYSSLDKEIELDVKHEDIRENFKNLYELNIPVIHYYRPFLSQNFSKEKIKETFKFVHKYTHVSATMGLMYVPTMLEKQDFWEELKKLIVKN